jgi:carbon monoxide dehydrogenase subunit G
MDMSGEYKIPAARETVWDALNDPRILQQAIPGAESVTRLSDTEFEAIAKAKVGPVSARFKGKVTLSDIDAPNGYTISGEGNGGVAGFARGSARVTLEDALDGGTLLSYTVNAQIGGKLAQIGQRFIDSTAAKLSEEFFSNFSKLAGGGSMSDNEPKIISEHPDEIALKSPDQDAIAPTGSPLIPSEQAGIGLSPWLWGSVLIVVLVILAAFFGR